MDESKIGSSKLMRKTKELKRTRKQAGIQFRKGKKEEAYKLWGEAAKGYKDRNDKRKAKKSGKTAAAETPAS